MGDIVIVATVDKEHIQQMSNTTDDLLAVVKEQQAQIKELIPKNGILITALSNATSIAHTPTKAATPTAQDGNSSAAMAVVAAKAAGLTAKNKIEGGDTELKEVKG